MNCLRIVIAEDEIAIANLIKGLIDFDRLNIELVGMAYNGAEAYQLLEKEKPDILITDISMPVMTGLEMIQKAREDAISTHFIIISGLTSFNYAINALKMGVDDYLLKPINREELNNVLEKTVLKIAEEKKIDYRIRSLNEDSSMQNQKLRKSFLMNVLYNSEQLLHLSPDECNREYGFRFQPDSEFLMGVVLIDQISSLNLVAQNSILEQMMRSFRLDMKDQCYDLEFYAKNNQFIFLLNSSPALRERTIGTLGVICTNLTENLPDSDMTVTIGCGAPVDKPSLLSGSLQGGIKSLHARILLGKSRVFWAEELSSGKKSSYVLRSSDLAGLRSNIELREKNRFERTLLDIMKEAAQSCRSCPDRILDVMGDTISAVLSDLHKYQFIRQNITDLYLQYYDAIEQYDAITPLLKYSLNFITELLPFEEKKDPPENRQIDIAKAYIQEHFNENIKLEDVAEQVYLAHTYFGVLFKKEVGESFSSYLTSVRMEKAKEMLRDLQYSVGEIAPLVGYQDKRYFSKLFKEAVGVTPKEYRKIYVD